jgi:hypothetical protein
MAQKYLGRVKKALPAGIVDLIQWIVLAECASAEFGCCPDGKYPAHGENFLGRYRKLSRQRKENFHN